MAMLVSSSFYSNQGLLQLNSLLQPYGISKYIVCTDDKQDRAPLTECCARIPVSFEFHLMLQLLLDFLCQILIVSKPAVAFDSV